MYQTDMLRSGPMGDMIITLRFKFLEFGTVDIVESEKGFLLYSLNDILTTSHSSIVQSQLGSTLKFLRPDTQPYTTSQISDLGSSTTDSVSGTYNTEWQVIQSCLSKIGLAPPPPHLPLAVGPDGDLNAISTPMHHDIDDGTGYNYR
jgi:hypothetical protein